MRLAVVAFVTLSIIGIASAAEGIAQTRRTPPCCVALGPQTRTTNCEFGLIPDLACSPGVILNSSFAGSLCGRSSVPGGSRLSAESKREIGLAYGLPAATKYGPTHTYEIVPVIPFILNGTGEDLSANYPMPSRYLNARAKLVRFLSNQANCPPWKLTQQQAQHAMLDWAGTYALVFGRQPPAGSL